MSYGTWILRPAVAAALLVGFSVSSPAQEVIGTVTATATVKTAAGAQMTAPVTIVVTKLTTDAERTAAAGALKTGGTAGLIAALKAMKDLGYIEIGGRQTAIKYAYARQMGAGHLLTVVAPAPIAYLGAGLPNAPAKAGFDLSFAILQLSDSGPGTGELAPAATLTLDDAGAVQTKDYGSESVQLTDVKVKKP